MQKLEQLFALSMHQKIQCVGRETASKIEESTSYQVRLLRMMPPSTCWRQHYAELL